MINFSYSRASGAHFPPTGRPRKALLRADVSKPGGATLVARGFVATLLALRPPPSGGPFRRAEPPKEEEAAAELRLYGCHEQAPRPTFLAQPRRGRHAGEPQELRHNPSPARQCPLHLASPLFRLCLASSLARSPSPPDYLPVPRETSSA